MSASNQSVFSDPKVIISLVAILLSAISLLWTFISNREQNRRWDELNLCRVELVDASFIMWKEINLKEALLIDWGYQPILFPHVENGLLTGKVRIPYELLLINPATQKRIPNSNGFFTISEAEQEIKRLGLDKSKNNWLIVKHFQASFVFKNIGNTTASDLRADITVEYPEFGLDPQKIVETGVIRNLYPNTKTGINADMLIPVESTLPDKFLFNVVISYKDSHNDSKERNILVTYDSKTNNWYY